MSKDFFLNILITLVPVLFYQVYHDRCFLKPGRRSSWVIGILGGLSAILCVKYPFVDGYGIWWDFRIIPMTLAVLYGGFGAGLLATVMEIIYRASLGSGALFSILFTCVYLILPFLLVRSFYNKTPKRRMVLSVLLSFVAYLMLLSLVALHVGISPALTVQAFALEKLAFLLMIGVLQALTMLMSVWLIESMISNTKLRAEMQRTEKLGIISEMAASVAHEIRNPLTVVRGFLQLLGSTSDSKQQNYLQTAISELDRAEFIISDYLSFAKPQAESIGPVDATKHLHDVMLLTSSFAVLHGVHLEQHIDDSLWVRANQDRLKQAVINLLKNSIEACTNGGGVKLLAYRDQRHVVIQVIDTGEGMTAQEVERLGNPFYSTKEKGTGLGLMVTFRIIEAMDGTLTFTSKKGVGTQATIRFPAMLPTLERSTASS